MNKYHTIESTRFKVGDRVKTKRPEWGATIRGTVERIIPGYDDIHEGEHVKSEPGIVIKVDKKPPRWPYPEDTFAPDESSVEILA